MSNDQIKLIGLWVCLILCLCAGFVGLFTNHGAVVLGALAAFVYLYPND
jgi:hypothetical protein